MNRLHVPRVSADLKVGGGGKTHRDVRHQIEPERRKLEQVSLLLHILRTLRQEVDGEDHGGAEAADREPGGADWVSIALSKRTVLKTHSTQSPFLSE